MSKRKKIWLGAGGLGILAAIILFLILRPKVLWAPAPVSIPDRKVAEIIGNFDPANPRSFMEIQKIIDMGEEAVDPLLDLVNSESAAEQWAAVVGLSALRRDMNEQEGIAQVLRNMYQSEFLTVRLYAAYSNAQYGDWSGGPVLLEGLKSREIMSYMEPPTPAAIFANRVLEMISGEDFGFEDAEDKRGAITNWERWWMVKQMGQNL